MMSRKALWRTPTGETFRAGAGAALRTLPPPPDLNPMELRVWQDVIARAHWLVVADCGTLLVYCTTFGRWQAAVAAAKAAPLFTTNRAGTAVEHPAHRLAARLARDMFAQGAALGLSPGGRNRMPPVPPAPEPAPIERLATRLEAREREAARLRVIPDETPMDATPPGEPSDQT